LAEKLLGQAAGLFSLDSAVGFVNLTVLGAGEISVHRVTQGVQGIKGISNSVGSLNLGCYIRVVKVVIPPEHLPMFPNLRTRTFDIIHFVAFSSLQLSDELGSSTINVVHSKVVSDKFKRLRWHILYVCELVNWIERI
jgi:hypothetical protein